MRKQDFRHWAHRATDWAADYYESLSERAAHRQQQVNVDDVIVLS